MPRTLKCPWHWRRKTRWLDAVCSMLVAKAPSVVCSMFPPAMSTALLVLSFAGFAVTLYRAYRDFYCGDYYLDLAEAGYL